MTLQLRRVDLPRRGPRPRRGPNDGGRPEVDHGGSAEGRGEDEKVEQNKQK